MGSFDRYSRDDVIGEVMLELEHVDLKESEHNPVPISKEITPRSFKLKSQGRGEILVSLCYQPAANRITVVVLKARNLPKMDVTGLSGKLRNAKLVKGCLATSPFSAQIPTSRS